MSFPDQGVVGRRITLAGFLECDFPEMLGSSSARPFFFPLEELMRFLTTWGLNLGFYFIQACSFVYFECLQEIGLHDKKEMRQSDTMRACFLQLSSDLDQSLRF